MQIIGADHTGSNPTDVEADRAAEAGEGGDWESQHKAAEGCPSAEKGERRAHEMRWKWERISGMVVYLSALRHVGLFLVYCETMT